MKNHDKLDGLKKISRVDAPPFLFTRIKGQIESLNPVAEAPLPWRWSFATAAMIVLALNTGILVAKLTSQQESGVSEIVSSMQLSNQNSFYNE
ncbi:hypothetical protein [Persicitalea jodogahamensis]|uniref:Uncharacterized protein n=1 Tax=Persicitalea jodogahamensis TaxID=402147 RepID=A0A8J3DAR4_9BACT|nr:hypothetical protein [Persicitalea jodogahamensis]GHB76901.1 hypothetical protein GCM10007390_33600 [Persicitalea jodogahamensis]